MVVVLPRAARSIALRVRNAGPWIGRADEALFFLLPVTRLVGRSESGDTEVGEKRSDEDPTQLGSACRGGVGVLGLRLFAAEPEGVEPAIAGVQ